MIENGGSEHRSRPAPTIGSVDDLPLHRLAELTGVPPDDIERIAAMGVLSREAAPFAPGDVIRVRLLQVLEQAGISPKDVGAAVASGDFSFAFVEALFPSPTAGAYSNLTFDALCRQFGFSLEFVQDVYAGLGLPQPGREDRVRQDDVDMAPVLLAIMGLPMVGTEGAIAHATRFWGENLHRLAQAEVSFFSTYVIEPLLRSGLPERQMLEIALPQGAMAQELDERVLSWLHHRHLEQALLERVLDHVEAAIERTGAIRQRPREIPAIAFVDLSGFTALTESQGDEAAVRSTVALSELVRSVTARHGGHPVKFLGDGVMCHFRKPGEALLASLEMIEGTRPAGLPPAHIGLHTGPVIERDGDYFGRTVNVAARVVGHAIADEVLVTDDVVRTTMVDGVRFERLEPVSLKGVATPVTLHRVHRSSASE